jgi:hypothetical protein
MEDVKYLDPAVHVNMDNYKPYSDIRELRTKAKEHLKSLQGMEYCLGETNPNIKFFISSYSINHTIRNAGIHKLILTKQLPEIFKQANINGVEDEKKGDENVLHILKCSTYIMIERELYQFHFVLKMKKGGKNFLYDGTINISFKEKERTA